jgi:methionine synthase II (cobalamin-independent)
MLTSHDRILTTHTGRLPRPAELTAPYVQRARREPVDGATLDAAGRAAVHEVVAKQLAASVDIAGRRRVADWAVWAKLDVMAEGAKIAAQRLY